MFKLILGFGLVLVSYRLCLFVCLFVSLTVTDIKGNLMMMDHVHKDKTEL